MVATGGVSHSFDVAVVGAGVIGLAVARELAERGVDVVVVERSGIAAGASGVQPGGVRCQWATRVNCLLARESLVFYREIGERLGTRLQPRFSPCGYAFVAHSAERLRELQAAVTLQHELDIPSRLLSAAETAEAVPELDPSSIVGAAWCAEDGYFDRAQEPVEAFAEAARAHGVAFEIAEVVGLERDGEGWRLETRPDRGIRAGHVVVAAACDSAALAARVGVDLAISAEQRHLFLSEPVPERLLEPLVVASEIGLAAKQLADGRVLASDLRAVGDPARDAAGWRETVRRGIESLLPRLQLVSFPLLVSGTYDVTPDHNPFVGELPGAAGVWVAAGFSGHGFMIAPAIGRLVAEAIVSGHSDPLLAPFAVDRFAGAVAVPETQIV